MAINFTNEQNEILKHFDENIFINATAGAGKSTLLSEICSRIINSNVTNYTMLVTFTNKSAKDIIAKCSNVDNSRIIGGTFHSIAYKLLRMNGHNLSICDSNKQSLILKKVFNCKKDKNKLSEMYEYISNEKSKFPCDYSDPIIKKYQDELDKYGLLDFDDIIHKFIIYAKESDFKIYNITHILVDEMQDTSPPQFQMLKTIQNKLNCKVIGCGDFDQNIYSFRGAEPKNIHYFIDIFKAKIMNMGINFRCAKNIVNAANNIIKNNNERLDKNIRAHKIENGFVKIEQHGDEFSEIARIIAICKIYRSKEITILYRNRTHKSKLEFELKKNNLKYIVNDFLEITDRSSVKSIMSIIRIASKEFDEFDLINASKALQGFAEGTVKKIININKTNIYDSLVYCFDDKKLSTKLNSLKEIINFFIQHKDRPLSVLVNYIEQYFTKSFKYPKDMKNFLLDITSDYKMTLSSVKDLYEDLGLGAKEENYDNDANIKLSTIHGFKGGQSPLIIIPWAHQIFPKNILEIEEERRLFYVAITRAEEGLYIFYSGEPTLFIEELTKDQK